MTEIIKRTEEDDPDFLQLVERLDAELRVRDGDEHEFYAQFNKPVGLAGVVVAYVDERPVGCGAFKPFGGKTAEIKRMFVDPKMRGRRIAARLLAELEVWSRELDFQRCILETGFKQPEAIALYRRSGYAVIENYGQYAGMENSICMEKAL